MTISRYLMGPEQAFLSSEASCSSEQSGTKPRQGMASPACRGNPLQTTPDRTTFRPKGAPAPATMDDLPGLDAMDFGPGFLTAPPWGFDRSQGRISVTPSNR